MNQSRAMLLVEESTSVATGVVLSLAMQAVLFPVVGLQATLAQTLKLALGFTILSILRSYVVRRLFERVGGRRTGGGRISAGSRPGPAGGALCAHSHDSDRGSEPRAR